MSHLLKDILRMGVLERQYDQEETGLLMGIIHRFGELVPKCSKVDQICKSLVRIVIEETDFENCSLLLWDPDKGCLTLSAAFGLDDLSEGECVKYNRDLKFVSGEGVAGRVFSSRRPVFLEDSRIDSIPVMDGAVVQPVSLACLPVLNIGVLNLSACKPHRFPREKRRSWELLGKMIGYQLLESTLGKVSFDKDAYHAGEAPDDGITGTTEGPDNPMAVADLSDQAIDRTPQGICLLDSKGNVLKTNSSFSRMYDGDITEVISKSPSSLFQEPDLFIKLMNKVGSSTHEEMTNVNMISANGEVYPADVYLSQLSNDQGMASGYVLMVNDMSRKKAFEEKMLQTEKLASLGTMAGGVAHDFNNLLMAVLGNIQLILPRVTDEEIRRRLSSVEKAVHDGANTVRRLQKFTERNKGHVASAAPVDVSEAIRDVVELTRPRWKSVMEKRGHDIEVMTECESHCLAGINASDLREILTNLIFNAIEAMPEGGKVILSSESDSEWVLVKVSDTGIGMSKEVESKIFDPFYTTKGVGNSGLGLSVCWSLAGRYGGDIQVKSEPGKGSEFLLRLPKALNQEIDMDLSLPLHNTNSYRLLVVDDDEEILSIVQEMLSLKGHMVIALHNSEEALGLIKQEDFDLVFTDLGMPAVNGWDIAACVKEKGSDIPVVLLTGWGAQYEEEDISSRGVDLVLSKPLSWEKLLGSIDKLLYTKRAA